MTQDHTRLDAGLFVSGQVLRQGHEIRFVGQRDETCYLVASPHIGRDEDHGLASPLSRYLGRSDYWEFPFVFRWNGQRVDRNHFDLRVQVALLLASPSFQSHWYGNFTAACRQGTEHEIEFVEIDEIKSQENV